MIDALDDGKRWRGKPPLTLAERLADAAAVVPTARHALKALLERCLFLDDQDAVAGARATLSSFEWVALRIEARLAERAAGDD